MINTYTYTYLTSKHPTPLCNKCQQHLTIQNIIQDCPDLQKIRYTQSMSDELDKALNEENTIKILNFLTKINKLINLWLYAICTQFIND